MIKRRIRRWLADLITGGEYSQNKRQLAEYVQGDLVKIVDAMSPTETPFTRKTSRDKPQDFFSWGDDFTS